MNSELTDKPAAQAAPKKVLTFFDLQSTPNWEAGLERNRIAKALIKIPNIRARLSRAKQEQLDRIADMPVMHYVAEPAAIPPLTLLSGRNGASQYPLFVAKGNETEPMIAICLDTSSASEHSRMVELMAEIAKHGALFKELEKPVGAAQLFSDAEDLIRFISYTFDLNYSPIVGFMFGGSMACGFHNNQTQLHARKLTSGSWLDQRLKRWRIDLNMHTSTPTIKQILNTPIKMGWIFPGMLEEVKIGITKATEQQPATPLQDVLAEDPQGPDGELPGPPQVETTNDF